MVFTAEATATPNILMLTRTIRALTTAGRPFQVAMVVPTLLKFIILIKPNRNIQFQTNKQPDNRIERNDASNYEQKAWSSQHTNITASGNPTNSKKIFSERTVYNEKKESSNPIATNDLKRQSSFSFDDDSVSTRKKQNLGNSPKSDKQQIDKARRLLCRETKEKFESMSILSLRDAKVDKKESPLSFISRFALSLEMTVSIELSASRNNFLATLHIGNLPVLIQDPDLPKPTKTNPVVFFSSKSDFFKLDHMTVIYNATGQTQNEAIEASVERAFRLMFYVKFPTTSTIESLIEKQAFKKTIKVSSSKDIPAIESNYLIFLDSKEYNVETFPSLRKQNQEQKKSSENDQTQNQQQDSSKISLTKQNQDQKKSSEIDQTQNQQQDSSKILLPAKNEHQIAKVSSKNEQQNSVNSGKHLKNKKKKRREKSFSDIIPWIPQSLPDAEEYPLHYAAAVGNFPLIKKLIANSKTDYRFILDNHGRYPVHWLAQSQDVTAVRNAGWVFEAVALLVDDSQWNVPKSDTDSKPTLQEFFALESRNARAISVLCTMDKQGGTPLCISYFIDAFLVDDFTVSEITKVFENVVGGKGRIGVRIQSLTGSTVWHMFAGFILSNVLKGDDLKGKSGLVWYDDCYLNVYPDVLSLWCKRGNLDYNALDWAGRTGSDILNFAIQSLAENSHVRIQLEKLVTNIYAHDVASSRGPRNAPRNTKKIFTDED
ncbi:hypothetical protein HK096_000115 [Nowakowskiella sp. JEL0078]|nr:hypothetical protein HK096_000115 [Nowakowskiella sp. JEL0078]